MLIEHLREKRHMIFLVGNRPCMAFFKNFYPISHQMTMKLCIAQLDCFQKEIFLKKVFQAIWANFLLNLVNLLSRSTIFHYENRERIVLTKLLQKKKEFITYFGHNQKLSVNLRIFHLHLSLAKNFLYPLYRYLNIMKYLLIIWIVLIL